MTTGSLVLDGWAGRSRTVVEVVGETPHRLRTRAIEPTRLAGRERWLLPWKRPWFRSTRSSTSPTSKRRVYDSPGGMILSASACTAPTGPSAGTTGFLAGTWAGTLTIWPDAQPATTLPTSWTFTVVRGTAGLGFTTPIRSPHPAIPQVIDQASTTLTPPGLPPAEISTAGGFEFALGCRALFGSVGSADPHHIHADFNIAGPCGLPVYFGSVDLSR